MARGTELERLVDDLSTAKTFERAAARLLAVVIEECERCVGASDLVGAATIERAMVHIRPDEGYRRLHVIEPDDSPAPPDLDLVTVLRPSSTCWRWIVERECELMVDVNLGLIAPIRGPAIEAAANGDFVSAESRGLLLSRSASHVLVMPIRAIGGGIAGMISVEAACRAAIGKPFVWEAALARLRIYADVAAPYLTGLPTERASPGAIDEWLPVVGRSMFEVISLLGTFAEQDETLLLAGPTGCGKSKLARWCHERSPRRGKPFVTIDLATIPEDLQLAELFGWRKGAFTGATRDTKGAIGRADQGTLFIDEIDKLSLRAQAGLLRLLEDRVYRPLGEDAEDRSASIRFVIGTNARLRDLVKTGGFREDLYYRIHVLPVAIPSLDERRDEIADWAGYMLRRHHAERGRGGEAWLSDAARVILSARGWPGNLRQLDNVIRRAYTIALVRLGPAVTEAELCAEDVTRALGLEGDETTVPVLEILELAARAYVAEVDRRPIELEHTDALRGLTLLEACDRLGSREEAFRALGLELAVKNRNHLKTLRLESQKVKALYEAFGRTVPARLSKWILDERE